MTRLQVIYSGSDLKDTMKGYEGFMVCGLGFQDLGGV